VTDIFKPKPTAFSFPEDPDELLVEVIATSNLPFSICHNESFRRFVAAVRSRPSWAIPSRQTFSTTTLNASYSKVVKALKNTIENCIHVAMTTDGFTGPRGQSYWSLTFQGITSDFALASGVLQFIPVYNKHNVTNLAAIIRPILELFGVLPTPEAPNKLVAFVTNEGGAAPCISEAFSHHPLCRPSPTDRATQGFCRSCPREACCSTYHGCL
jgi:hypothetical protein